MEKLCLIRWVVLLCFEGWRNETKRNKKNKIEFHWIQPIYRHISQLDYNCILFTWFIWLTTKTSNSLSACRWCGNGDNNDDSVTAQMCSTVRNEIDVYFDGEPITGHNICFIWREKRCVWHEPWRTFIYELWKIYGLGLRFYHSNKNAAVKKHHHRRRPRAPDFECENLAQKQTNCVVWFFYIFINKRQATTTTTTKENEVNKTYRLSCECVKIVILAEKL